MHAMSRALLLSARLFASRYRIFWFLAITAAFIGVYLGPFRIMRRVFSLPDLVELILFSALVPLAAALIGALYGIGKGQSPSFHAVLFSSWIILNCFCSDHSSQSANLNYLPLGPEVCAILWSAVCAPFAILIARGTSRFLKAHPSEPPSSPTA
jgi:hypothetical protein